MAEGFEREATPLSFCGKVCLVETVWQAKRVLLALSLRFVRLVSYTPLGSNFNSSLNSFVASSAGALEPCHPT